MQFGARDGGLAGGYGVVGAFGASGRRVGRRRGGGRGVGFWGEIFENFEKLGNGPESIGDGFGKGLGVFRWSLGRWVVVLRLFAASWVRFGCILRDSQRSGGEGQTPYPHSLRPVDRFNRGIAVTL